LGGKGEILVCNPFVEKDDEYSTAQVSLLNGSYDDYELVESGWAVRSNGLILFVILDYQRSINYFFTNKLSTGQSQCLWR
jgi:hypothetical protein